MPLKGSSTFDLVEVVIAFISAAAALVGAAIGANASRRSAQASAAVAERVAKADRAEEIRRMAAKAYSDACVAVEWLQSVRVEDSILAPFQAELESEYHERSARLRRARDVLSEVAALAPPLADHARRCAHQLGQLDEAWREGRRHAERHYDTSGPNVQLKTWHGKQLSETFRVIDELRDSLLGEPLRKRELQPDVTDRSPGLLDALRSAIADLDRHPGPDSEHLGPVE
jgi:hypothetical protein